MAIEYVDSTQLDSDLTSVANAIRAKSGGSSQLAFPAGFVSEIQAIPSGGGASALIASGTYTGAGTFNGLDFPVGKKMPKTDFLFVLTAPNGTVFVNDSDYKVAQFFANGEFVVFDLSADADSCPSTATVIYEVDWNGTLMHPQAKPYWYDSYVRAANVTIWTQGNTGWNRVKRDSNGFYISVRNYPTTHYLVNGLVYNWFLYYFGSDPTNDIVEVP